MKRRVFVLTALVMAYSGYPQDKPTLKSEFSSFSAIQADRTIFLPFKSKPLTTAVPAPATIIKNNRNVNTVNIISIGTSANAYSYGYSGGQRSILCANNNINTVSHIHRMGGALDPGGYSGDLGVDVSTNGGVSFTNMNEIFTSTIPGGSMNLDAARFPAHGIYNPAGNTNPNNAYITFFAPTLDGTNSSGSWGGYAYGRACINNYIDTTKNLFHSIPPYYQYIPDAYDVSEDGIAIAVDANINYSSGSGVYQGSLIISRGLWSAAQEDFIFTRSLINFPTNDENDAPSHISFAFGPDGQTGWIAVISDNESVIPLTDHRYFYPIFLFTTNGGVTWSEPIEVRLDGPLGLPGVLNYLTDEQIEDLFEPPVPDRDEIPYTTAFDCDLVVDKWGNPHLSVVIGVGGSSDYSIITASETFAAFDISTVDGGTTWDGWNCGNLKQFRGTFGSNFIEDNRIQASSTQDGGKVFIAWLDTQMEGASENTSPDIFARGVDVSPAENYRYLSTDPDGEDQPDCVTCSSMATWQAYFAVASRYTLSDEEGNYTIPFSYEQLSTPFDPSLPVQYKYIKDFTFTDDDFIPVVSDTADIEVVPTSMTIYQQTSSSCTATRNFLSEDTLTIYNVGNGNLTVTLISATESWINLNWGPELPFEIGPGGSQAIFVDINWGMLGGISQSGNIIIHSDDFDEPVVEVPVTAVPEGIPDLTILDHIVDPTTIEAGTNAYVSCNVINQGSANAQSSSIKYYLSEDVLLGSDDIELGSDIVESLDSGQVSFQEDTLLIPANTEPGLWLIIFYADADEIIAEIDETNNQAYNTINIIVSKPDLVVQDAAADPPTIEPGGLIETECSVVNQGDATSGSSILNYYLSLNSLYEPDDIILGSDTVVSLGPTKSDSLSQTLVLPSSTAPGNWYILFYADAEGQVVESDEDNNISYAQIIVEDITFLKDNALNHVDVYPNPFADKLFVNISSINEKAKRIDIINSEGIIVRQYPVSRDNPGILAFNSKELPPGVYVLRINLENAISQEIILIKK